MAWQGDYRTTDTVYLTFTTVSTTGAPTTLAGTPKARCYKSGSTTESSDITPTVDFDSRTGLHLLTIDLTGDSGFYAAAKDYSVILTAGTVGGTSVVGYNVGDFSVENRSAVMPTTAARKLVVDAAGLADANVVKVGPTGSGTAQTARDVGASVLLSTGTGTGQLDFTSGVVKANATQFAGQTITAAAGVTLPSSVASPTNITAGTITTATNVTTVNGLAAAVITATSIAADAITDAKVASDVTIASVTGAVGSVTGAVGSVTGAVGSVTGAVGSVTGNVGGNVVGSVASVTAAVAITSNVKKNQALAKFAFLMTDSTNHNPATGKTVTCTRSIDGGAFAAGTLASVAEVSNGVYTVNFGAGDLNGNVIVLRATATASDDTFERIETQP